MNIVLIFTMSLVLAACANPMAEVQGNKSSAAFAQSQLNGMTPSNLASSPSVLDLLVVSRNSFADCFGRPGPLRQVTYVYKRVYSVREGREIALKAHVTYNDLHDGSNQYPAVAMFHGGGWTNGAPTFWFGPAFYLASRGVVTVTFEYRLGTRIEESVADARSAMRWMRKYSAELAINPRKIMAAGDSAGGHLALTTSLVDSISDENLADRNISSDADAIFAAYPVTVGSLYNLAPAISPIDLLSAANPLPATKIVHGTTDSIYITPFSGSRNFCDRANSVSGSAVCELVPFVNQEHAFLGVPNAYRPAIAKLDSFLMDLGWLTGDYSQLQNWVTNSAPHCNMITAVSIDGWSAPYGYDRYVR